MSAVRKLSSPAWDWASKADIFDAKWDSNLVIHFHRYWCRPDIAVYKEFLAKSAELDVPLYLGETGENNNEWYAAMYPLSLSLGIGWNIWPWKKMACTNSPYSVRPPKGWEKIQQYGRGGERPSFAEAQAILDGYLENMKIENCDYNPAVTASFCRRPGSAWKAADFDELPGRGISYFGEAVLDRGIYRDGTGMRLVGGNEWNQLDLLLAPGEWAEYSMSESAAGGTLHIIGDGEITVTAGNKTLGTGTLPLDVKIPAGDGEITVRITGNARAKLHKLEYR